MHLLGCENQILAEAADYEIKKGLYENAPSAIIRTLARPSRMFARFLAALAFGAILKNRQGQVIRREHSPDP